MNSYVLLGGAGISIAYLVYSLMDTEVKLNKDRLMQNAKYFEKMMESMVEKESNQTLKKYNKMIRELIPSRYGLLNIYVMLVISISLAILTFGEMKILLNQSLAAALLSFMAFRLPFEVLEIIAKMRKKALRAHLPNFLLLFQQVFLSTGDSYQTLLIIKDEVKEPLNGYIKDFLYNTGKKSMELKDAIRIMKERSNNEVFRQFCDQLYNDMEDGQGMNYGLSKMIEDAYMNEKLAIEQVTESFGSIVAIGMILGFGINIVYSMINLNPKMISILKTTSEGKMVVVLVISLLLAVLVLIKKSLEFEDK